MVYRIGRWDSNARRNVLLICNVERQTEETLKMLDQPMDPFKNLRGVENVIHFLNGQLKKCQEN